MNYDIEDAIRKCEEIKKDNEIIAFTVGCGRIAPKIGMMKKQKQAAKFIASLKGFIGVHPVDLWHTLVIFDTLNNAKGGKNMMTAKGIQCGTYICPILVEKSSIHTKEDANE